MPQNSNEIIAGRDVIAYVEPWAAANTFPTISAWGASPGGSWVDQGYTKDGAHVQWRMQYQEYTVDQQLDPVARIPSQRDLRLRANLGQLDSAFMVNATGQGTSASTSASTGVRGHNDFTLTGTINANYYSVFYDVRSPVSGEAARIVGWQGRSVGDINIDFHIPDVAQVNQEFALVPDTSVIPARVCQIQVITPAL